MLVVVHHVELYNKRDGAYSLYSSAIESSLRVLGRHSVEVFFVLSGFLITYLLRREQDISGRVKLGAFWIRRTLRIWPLYFLIVLIAFVLMPLMASETVRTTTHYGRLIAEQSGMRSQLIWYFVLFLPNLALAHDYAVPGAAQAWSIGVEEQFYFLWPLLMRVTRKYFWILCVLITAKPIICRLIHYRTNLFPIEFMGWGALGALVLYRYEQPTKALLRNVWLRMLVLPMFAVCWMTPVVGGHNYKMLIARGLVFVLGLLMVTSVFEHLKEPKVFRWLGKHSYGIYMLHPFAMFVFLSLLPVSRSGQFQLAHWLRDYSLVVGSTLVAAAVSYRYFERPFLSIKERFQVVKSGA